MGKLLKQIYYDFNHPASFGGVNQLSKASKFSRSKTEDWLRTQDVYTLHKPVRRNYPRRKTIAYGINELWQADLVDLKKYSKENKGYQYLLTVIDVFSKQAYSIPLKKKSSSHVHDAFQKLFQNQKPLNLQTDNGKEFYNSIVRNLFKKENINHYSSKSDTKSSVVERFNRTLKNKMFRVFTFRKSYKYYDILDELLHSYNASVHRSTGYAPSKVKPSHESEIFEKLYSYKSREKCRFKLNDQVRISKLRRTFHKGYLPGWTDEIFIIDKCYRSQPPTYLLKDLKNKRLLGRFYEPEIQKVKKASKDFWDIEKILDTKGKGKNKKYFVKWRGFDNRFNSWIDASWMK